MKMKMIMKNFMEKICENCKFFEIAGKDLNVCKKLSSELFCPEPMLSCATGDETEPFISVSPEYGCVLFENK